MEQTTRIRLTMNMLGRKLFVNGVVLSTSCFVSYKIMSLFIERYREKRIDIDGGK